MSDELFEIPPELDEYRAALYVCARQRKEPDPPYVPPAPRLRERLIVLYACLRHPVVMQRRRCERAARLERERTARALRLEGLPWKAIGQRLGVSGPTAQQWALRAERRERRDSRAPHPLLASPELQIPLLSRFDGPLTQAEAVVTHWRAQGVPWHDIAVRLDCSLGKARELGHSAEHKRRKAEREAASRRLAGQRRVQIAKTELLLQEAYLAALRQRGRAVWRSPLLEVGTMARGQSALPSFLVWHPDWCPDDEQTCQDISSALEDEVGEPR